MFPKGLSWDAVNYSCGYDAVFSILFSVWKADPSLWTRSFCEVNPKFMGILVAAFPLCDTGTMTLERTRDIVRNVMHLGDPAAFPYGRNGCDVIRLLKELSQMQTPVTSTSEMCGRCGCRCSSPEYDQIPITFLGGRQYSSTTEWINSVREPTERRCHECGYAVDIVTTFMVAPPILSMDLNTRFEGRIDTDVFVPLTRGVRRYTLAGIIYYGEFHFTSRIFSGGGIWYHDGRETGSTTLRETESSISSYLVCRGRVAVCAVYVRRDVP